MPKVIKKKCDEKKTVQDTEVQGFALEALDAAKGKQKQIIENYLHNVWWRMFD